MNQEEEEEKENSTWYLVLCCLQAALEKDANSQAKCNDSQSKREREEARGRGGERACRLTDCMKDVPNGMYRLSDGLTRIVYGQSHISLQFTFSI